MNFADELRNGKGLEKQAWSPSTQDKKDVQIILEMLKGEALSSNRNGKKTVRGYLTYYGYDWDTWRLISADEKVVIGDLGANGFGVKRNDDNGRFQFLQSEIREGLKRLGFHNITVRPETVQLYEKVTAYWFKQWKIVEYGREETLKIEFFW